MIMINFNNNEGHTDHIFTFSTNEQYVKEKG